MRRSQKIWAIVKKRILSIFLKGKEKFEKILLKDAHMGDNSDFGMELGEKLILTE